MKAKILFPIVEGFFGSIRLASSIFVGIAISIVNVSSSFVNHTLTKPSGDGQSHAKSL
jgi:hypothetical protein